MSFLGAPPPLPGERGRGRGRGRGGRGEGSSQSQYYKSVQGQLRLHAQEAAGEAIGGRVEVRGCM